MKATAVQRKFIWRIITISILGIIAQISVMILAISGHIGKTTDLVLALTILFTNLAALAWNLWRYVKERAASGLVE